MTDDEGWITAAEAERQLGVPASSVRAWAARQLLTSYERHVDPYTGERDPALPTVRSRPEFYGLTTVRPGPWLYRVDEIRGLIAGRPRRKKHSRPARRATDGDAAIERFD